MLRLPAADERRPRGVPRHQPLHSPPYPTQTLAARRALAAALVLVKLRKPSDRLHNIRRLVHDDNGSGAKGALDRLQAVKIHQHCLADRFRETRHARTPGDDSQKVVPAAAHSAAMPVDQLLERNAHLLFDVAGRVHMTRQTVDLGTGVSRPPDPGEPRRTSAQYRRYDRDSLDIVNCAWTAIETNLRRKRRFQPRLALASFEALEKPRLLAANIGAGSAMQMEFEIIARTR